MGTVDLPTTENPYEIDGGDYLDSEDELFSCPDCEYEFDSSEVSQINEDFLEANPRTAERIELRRSQRGGRQEEGEGSRAVINVQYRRFKPQMGTGMSMVECPHCSYVFEDTPSGGIICPRCGHESTLPQPTP